MLILLLSLFLFSSWTLILAASELYPKLMLFSISADRTLREWTLQLDSESPDLQFRIRGEQKHTPTCLYVRSEHEEVFVGCEDGSIGASFLCLLLFPPLYCRFF